jgi:hypothetical protein
VSWVRRLGYTKCDIHVKVTWQWLWSWILFKLGIPLKATLQGTQQWAPGPEQPVCCAYGRHMTISPTPEQPVCCACGSHMTMSPMQVWWAQGHYYNKSISPVPPCSTRMAQHRTKGRRAGIAHWNTQGEHDSSLTHQNWEHTRTVPKSRGSHKRMTQHRTKGAPTREWLSIRLRGEGQVSPTGTHKVSMTHHSHTRTGTHQNCTQVTWLPQENDSA